MRILIKILLSIGCLIIGVLLSTVLDKTGTTNSPVIRLIPAAVMIFGIIGVWRYKPQKESNTDLDKTL